MITTKNSYCAASEKNKCIKGKECVELLFGQLHKPEI